MYKMATPYDKDDAAEDTDASVSDVSTAWHDARDDAEADDDIDTSDWDRD